MGFTFPLISKEEEEKKTVCELCDEITVYFYSRPVQIVTQGGIVLYLY
jgi:hypothetical protein